MAIGQQFEGIYLDLLLTLPALADDIARVLLGERGFNAVAGIVRQGQGDGAGGCDGTVVGEATALLGQLLEPGVAATHDVSKQAISAIATELEELGYLQRQTDPADARQIVLQFTARGQELIADSVASVDQLGEEFAGIIGKAALIKI